MEKRSNYQPAVTNLQGSEALKGSQFTAIIIPKDMTAMVTFGIRAQTKYEFPFSYDRTTIKVMKFNPVQNAALNLGTDKYGLTIGIRLI